MRRPFFALLLLAGPLLADTVTRGPYLQLGRPDAMTVRWRTDVSSAGRLWVGLSTSALAVAGTEAASGTEHLVTASGLSPATLYYYRVGTSTGGVLAGGTTDHFFVTSPPPGASVPVRVWVLGDAGVTSAGSLQNAADQTAVRDAYLSYTGARRTDLWLMLGDNAYDSGTDAQYTVGLFDIYPALLRTSVLWPAPGNHDHGSHGGDYGPAASAAPYYDAFTLPAAGEAGGAASSTEAYYSFDHANVHFVSLDSHHSIAFSSVAMLSWLSADLAATTQTWTVAYWHHPPYTKGSHDSDSATDSCTGAGDRCRMTLMRERVLPLLEAAGVDLVLTGHSHNYERSYLLNGHYGMSDSLSPGMVVDGGVGAPPAPYVKDGGSGRGTVYVVCGVGGRPGGGSLVHPAMAVATSELGSLVIDVDGPRMDVTFLGADAGRVRDRFTIVKRPSPGGRRQTLKRK